MGKNQGSESTLRKSIFCLDNGVHLKQIQNKNLLKELEESATNWFEQVEPTLRSSYKFEDDSIMPYRETLLSKLAEIQFVPVD